MVSGEIKIINKLGLHARAAAKLVNTASRFSSELNIGTGQRMVNAKSIMSVMMLAASKGTTLTLEANGDDEAAAFAALEDIINRRFDEPE